MKNRIKILLLTSLTCSFMYGQTISDPVPLIRHIADKLVRETDFKYKLDVAPCDTTFNDMNFVNFGRTFGLGHPAVAYAYTCIFSSKEESMDIQLEHNDACKIWLNGKVVYEKTGNKNLNLVYDERSVELSSHCVLPLKKGKNDLLIKSETKGKQWIFFMQPPSQKGAVNPSIDYPTIGLQHNPDIDSKIAKLTNWLVIGPFEPGIDKPYSPESGMKFGVMYQGLHKEPVTWTIPKIEILGDMENAKDWGTTYQWSYHNGGVAWAMEQLSEVTHDSRYMGWADNFCNFHLEGIPFVQYQVKTLNYINSANHFIIDTPLLDFTLAPSLPFIYKLRIDSDFPNRAIYESFIRKMMDYAKDGQIRLPGSSIYTRVTPEKYTTWTDDMFMGIPFLVQASLYAKDESVRKAFLDDAASQVLNFIPQVFDKKANLYMHAHYSKFPDVKLPHWTRANGWATWAMSDVLKALPHSHPKYHAILQQYQKHMNALVKWQDKSGFWFNVPEYPSSKPEVSGTAIIVMSIARGINYGWLDAKKYMPILEKGWAAVSSQVEQDGTVHNICMGTMCSEDVNYYVNRPFYDNDTHGVFAVIFAGIDIYKMMKGIK
jgi:unsaturated rhamnogalacturonyl hydrolase